MVMRHASEALANIPWQDIVKTLKPGRCGPRGLSSLPQQRVAVARYLGKAGPLTPPTMTGYCAAGSKPKASARFLERMEHRRSEHALSA